MPAVVLKNTRFLAGFTKKRKYYDEWINEIIDKTRYHNSMQIKGLANSFLGKVSPLMILPTIYYLITEGIFHVDLSEKIDENSHVYINRDADYINRLFESEDIVNEIK
jgi:hypothetical protein